MTGPTDRRHGGDRASHDVGQSLRELPTNPNVRDYFSKSSAAVIIVAIPARIASGNSGQRSTTSSNRGSSSIAEMVTLLERGEPELLFSSGETALVVVPPGLLSVSEFGMRISESIDL